MSLKSLKSKFADVPVTAKASVAYAVCSIIQKCLSFITMPLFTRLLTTKQYGQVTVFNSWSGIFSIIITLNLAYGSFSPAMMKFKDRRDSYISAVQGIFLMMSGVFFLIYFPLSSYWNRFFDLPFLFVALLVLEAVATNAVQLWSGKMRFEYKYKGVVILTLVSSFLSTAAALTAVLLFKEKGYARIAGGGCVTVMIGGAVFFRNLAKGKELYNREYWKYALGFNIPLIAYYMSQTVFNQSDRLMINYFSGTDKAGIYGVAYNLAMILTFVLNSINNSYVPWFYQKIHEGKEKENANVSFGIAVLMAFMIICVVLMAPEIIYIMASPKYYEAIWVIPPVAISLLLLFYSQLFINVQFYYEQKKKLVLASVGAASANIILNAIFIPLAGFIAAGYTTLISYIIFAVMNYYTMKKVAGENNFSLDAVNAGLLVLLFIVFSAIIFSAMALYSYPIIRYLIIMCVLAVGVVKRRKIISYVNETILHRNVR